LKLAVTDTALLGILKVHGLLEEPPEHDAPETLHPAKVYPGLAIEYEIDTRSPTLFWYEPGEGLVVPPAAPEIVKEDVELEFAMLVVVFVSTVLVDSAVEDVELLARVVVDEKVELLVEFVVVVVVV
jgi:hypothetical protein